MNMIKFLKETKKSQTQLSKELGVSASNVNLWVNNKCFPSYEMCKKLLEMGMSVNDLFDIDYESIQSKVEGKDTEEFKMRSAPFQEQFEWAMEKWFKEKFNSKP